MLAMTTGRESSALASLSLNNGVMYYSTPRLFWAILMCSFSAQARIRAHFFPSKRSEEFIENRKMTQQCAQIDVNLDVKKT